MDKNERDELEAEKKALKDLSDSLSEKEEYLEEWDKNLSQWELRLMLTEFGATTQSEKTLRRLEDEFACSLYVCYILFSKIQN